MTHNVDKRKNNDERYMKEALKQAQKAFDLDEVPVGAVVVCNDSIIARGYNKVERSNTQSAHAEMIALQKAGKKIGDWRLLNCTIYVTLEPCAMCMHAILLHRIDRVVYGANSPLFGYQLDNKESDAVYKYDTLQVTSGVLYEKSAQLLKCFFKKKRRK